MIMTINKAFKDVYGKFLMEWGAKYIEKIEEIRAMGIKVVNGLEELGKVIR